MRWHRNSTGTGLSEPGPCRPPRLLLRSRPRLRGHQVLAELEDARREIAELRDLQGPAAEDDGVGGQSDAERLAAAQVNFQPMVGSVA